MITLSAEQQRLLEAVQAATEPAVEAQERALAAHRELDAAEKLKQLVGGDILCAGCMAKIEARIAAAKGKYEQCRAEVGRFLLTMSDAVEALEATLPRWPKDRPSEVNSAVERALEAWDEDPGYFR